LKYENKRLNNLNGEGAYYISEGLVKLINLNNLNLNLE
jgi:hypothetical protein